MSEGRQDVESVVPDPIDEMVCGDRLWVNDEAELDCMLAVFHDGPHAKVTFPGKDLLVWWSSSDEERALPGIRQAVAESWDAAWAAHEAWAELNDGPGANDE